MARIIENTTGRRNILLSADDIISVVREYQSVSIKFKDYELVRKKLSEKHIFIPEEFC